MLMIHYIAMLFLFIGLFFILISIIGLFRVNGTFNKLHIVGIADILGIIAFFIGIILLQHSIFSAIKIIFIVLLYLFVAPITTHIVSKLKYESKKRKRFI
jgi:multicomponent Na+:H+ antiporter subunit G